MSRRIEKEAELVRRRIEQGDPYWPSQLAVATAIALNFVLSSQVTIGPGWLLPGVEVVLLVALVVIAPRRATAHSRGRREFSLSVIGFVTLFNVASVALLVHYLVEGGRAGGRSLIFSGGALWATNILISAVWYWEMDRGGPVTRFLDPDAPVDFSFPQMQNPELAPPNWRPGFGDYLYMSLTNATAFSPTDTMPLTQTAKATMAVQSITALVTVGLVVARAVNILA